MKRLTRTPCPPGFAVAAATELARAQTHFQGTTNTDGFNFTAYKHPDVKARLTALTHGNCAYCEASYDATQPVDLEHYRPKGGFENDTGFHQPGYWWLAASWENLLPSCIRCNREENQQLFDGTPLLTGKGNRFPLADEASRATGIGSEIHEQPLLLDPSRDDPEDFIRFIDSDGHCIAVPVDADPTSLSARRARASIDIYGLNRADLVRQRSRYMTRAQRTLTAIVEAAHDLEGLRADQIIERQRIERLLIREFAALHEFTDGQDSHPGMLESIIRPVLDTLTVN
jgi:uncharacterized protein (TIGR02646 family)